MAIALVQSKSDYALLGTLTLTWDATPTSGNLLVVALAIRSDTNPSDPSGFTTAASISSATYSDYVRIIYKISDGSESSLSWTDLGASTLAMAWEFSGIAPSSSLDKTGTVSDDGAERTPPQASASTGTLSQADELAIVTWGYRDFSHLASASVDSGFTLTFNYRPDSTTIYGAGAYKIVSATTALQPSFSWSSGGELSLGSCIATFKAAAGGGSAEGGGMLLGSRRNRLTIP